MSIQQINYDTLTEVQKKTYREIIALRERNAARVEKIESTGLGLDIATARLEHMLNALVAFDILTMDQVLELNKSWELELRKQSQEILNRVEEAQRAAAAERARPKLIIPGR